jgi:hypothetical protein
MIQTPKFFKDREELAGPNGMMLKRSRCQDRTVAVVKKSLAISAVLKAARARSARWGGPRRGLEGERRSGTAETEARSSGGDLPDDQWMRPRLIDAKDASLPVQSPGRAQPRQPECRPTRLQER